MNDALEIVAQWDFHKELWTVKRSDVPHLVAEGRTQERFEQEAKEEVEQIFGSRSCNLKFRFVTD